MKKYIKGWSAALTMTVLVTVVGVALGWDLKYITGWWSCMAYSYFADKED